MNPKVLHPDLERAISEFEARVQARVARAGYLAFPNFETAYLWHKLFGRQELLPPSAGEGEDDLEPEDSELEAAGGEGEPGLQEQEDGNQELELEDRGPGDDDIDPESLESLERSAQEPEGEDDGDELEDEDSEDRSSSLDDLLERLGAYTPPPERERPELSGWDRWGFSVKRTEGRIHREFESWSDFVYCVNDDSLFAWNQGREVRNSHWTPDSPGGAGKSGRRFQKGPQWAGTYDWSEAILMATQTGWPEGRKLLSDALALIHPRPETYDSMSYDVAGAFPLVPLYCARDPQCMVDFDHHLRQPDPIVRIDFEISAYYAIEPEAMMLRGAAVLSLADQLEAQGRSTEIRLVVTLDPSCGVGNTRFSYAITFKRAGDYWDLDRAAFAIAFPATFRRLGFALLEQHGELQPSFQHGYGRVHHEPIPESHPNTIFIPGASESETPDSARAAVAIAAQKFLEEEEA